MNEVCCRWEARSPYGPLTLETGPRGVRSVLFGRRSPSAEPLCKDCRQIDEAFKRYFEGDGGALDVVPADVSGARTAFHRQVLETLRKIAPAGATTTYGALAAAVGKPGAARAVGSAMANNPVPLVAPCHRVLASRGTLGGYGGGLEMKRLLLELEGVALNTGRAIGRANRPAEQPRHGRKRR